MFFHVTFTVSGVISVEADTSEDAERKVQQMTIAEALEETGQDIQDKIDVTDVNEAD